MAAFRSLVFRDMIAASNSKGSMIESYFCSAQKLDLSESYIQLVVLKSCRIAGILVFRCYSSFYLENSNVWIAAFLNIIFESMVVHTESVIFSLLCQLQLSILALAKKRLASYQQAQNHHQFDQMKPVT